MNFQIIPVLHKIFMGGLRPPKTNFLVPDRIYTSISKPSQIFNTTPPMVISDIDVVIDYVIDYANEYSYELVNQGRNQREARGLGH